MAGLELVDAEDVLVELGGLFQVLDLERDVDDASHGNTSLSGACLSEAPYRPAVVAAKAGTYRDFTSHLRPAREAQACACSSRRSVARNIFEPVEVEVLDRARDRHPVQDLRRSGMQLVARQRLEELRVLVGAGLEDRAVEIL